MDVGSTVIEEIIIYNQLNQIIYNDRKLANEIDLSVFQPGLYIIEISSKENKTRHKIIKK